MDRGPALLQAVAERLIAAFLESKGHTDVRRVESSGDAGRGIDITCVADAGIRRIKVKADAYCGHDPAKAADRSLGFYRPPTGSFALEAIADASARTPGWALDSEADDLYYYFLAVPFPEASVAELWRLSDIDFARALNIDDDELVVIPMGALSAWFSANLNRYQSRPVATGAGSGWYRLVPRLDIEAGVSGVRSLGSVANALRD